MSQAQPSGIVLYNSAQFGVFLDGIIHKHRVRKSEIARIIGENREVVVKAAAGQGYEISRSVLCRIIDAVKPHAGEEAHNQLNRHLAGFKRAKES